MLFSPRSPSPRTAAAANIVSKHKRGSAAIKRTLVRQKHLRCDYPSFGSLRASSLHHRARCAVAQFEEAPLGTQLSCGRSLVQQTHRCDPQSVGAFAFLPRRLDGRAWHRKHNVTYKTAGQLKDAFVASTRKAIENATIGPHQQGVDNLQRELRSRATSILHQPNFVDATAASLARPRQGAVLNRASQTTHSGPIATVTENADEDSSASASAPDIVVVPAIPPAIPAAAVAAAPEPTARKRASPRCRTCGLPVKDWRQFHIVPQRPAIEGERHSTRYLQNDAWRHCTVPESLRLPGFPCPPGKELPRKRNRA